jgi:hypothetical protein
MTNVFKTFGEDADKLDDYYGEVSVANFLPTNWHTITARFVQTGVRKFVELSVWDEDGDHRHSFAVKRVDVLCLEDLVAQCKEFLS